MVSNVNNNSQQTSVLTNTKQKQLDLQKDNLNTQTAKSAAPKASADSVSLTPQASN